MTIISTSTSGMWVQSSISNRNTECWVMSGKMDCFPDVVVTKIPEGVTKIASNVLIAPGVSTENVNWGGQRATEAQVHDYKINSKSNRLGMPSYTAYCYAPSRILHLSEGVLNESSLLIKRS